jgi:hypothetical protein
MLLAARVVNSTYSNNAVTVASPRTEAATNGLSQEYIVKCCSNNTVLGDRGADWLIAGVVKFHSNNTVPGD